MSFVLLSWSSRLWILLSVLYVFLSSLAWFFSWLFPFVVFRILDFYVFASLQFSLTFVWLMSMRRRHSNYRQLWDCFSVFEFGEAWYIAQCLSLLAGFRAPCPAYRGFILFAGNGFQVEDALLRLVSLYLSFMSCRIFASFVTFKHLCLNQFLGRLWTISSWSISSVSEEHGAFSNGQS